MQAADNDTEDVLLGKMIHERVSIDQRPLHLNQFNIAVPQCEPVVQYIPISLVASLSIAILANDILDGVYFISAVACVHDDVSSSTVRWLHHTHHLCGALSRRGLLTPVLLRGILIVSILRPTLAVVLVIMLLVLALGLLLRGDHRGDNITVRTATAILAIRLLSV